MVFSAAVDCSTTKTKSTRKSQKTTGPIILVEELEDADDVIHKRKLCMLQFQPFAHLSMMNDSLKGIP